MLAGWLATLVLGAPAAEWTAYSLAEWQAQAIAQSTVCRVSEKNCIFVGGRAPPAWTCEGAGLPRLLPGMTETEKKITYRDHLHKVKSTPMLSKDNCCKSPRGGKPIGPKTLCSSG